VRARMKVAAIRKARRTRRAHGRERNVTRLDVLRIAVMDKAGDGASSWVASGGNVTRLTHEGREIFLVGHASVSKKSVEEVRRVIAALEPDTVCVELAAARHEALKDDTRWHGPGPGDVLAHDRAGLFLASLLFAGFQKRLGDRLGVRPGM